MASQLVGLPAVELADLVRRRQVSAREVVRAHLDRVLEVDFDLGAFQVVCAQQAMHDAKLLDGRDDLHNLPLAGVPVAIKDAVDVRGLPTRAGSLATPPQPATEDHELVRRLRSAGAIIVGKTRMPELGIWAWTDGAFGVTRSPWDPTRTSGGSSGGSAAAVAAGMVPLAHGSDGGGSIRIPAACCGIVGLKPGPGVVPGTPGRDWCGLSVNGPLVATVADAAAMLSAMSNRPELAAVAPVDRPLRVAVSVVAPLRGVSVDPEYAAAARRVGELLATAGHEVSEADPPYDRNTTLTAGVRATAGIAIAAEGLPFRRLQRRSRPHVLAGKVIRRYGWLRDAGWQAWRTVAAEFFGRYDILVVPTLAQLPIAAEGWMSRSWTANARAAVFAPFTQPWNLAGVPAAAIPAGLHTSGFPLSVQLVASSGSEQLVLSVAALIEAQQGWDRHPPAYRTTATVPLSRSS